MFINLIFSQTVFLVEKALNHTVYNYSPKQTTFEGNEPKRLDTEHSKPDYIIWVQGFGLYIYMNIQT